MDRLERRITDIEPGKDVEFLDHLLSLAQRAEGVVNEADKKCASLSEKGETDSGWKELASGPLAVQCGQFQTSDTEHAKVERYWQSVRIMASVQFSGSARRFEKAWDLFCRDRAEPWKSVPNEYWTWPEVRGLGGAATAPTRS